MRGLMAFVLLVSVSFRTLNAVPARSAQPAKPRPLSKADVMYLLQTHHDADLLQEIIGQLGVDFVLTPEERKGFRQAGATSQVLAVLRQSATITRASSLGVQPRVRRSLSEDDVLYLLRNYVPSRRVEIIGSQLGIDFQLTLTIEEQLRRAGATPDLLDGLKQSAPSVLLVHVNPAGAHVVVDGSIFEDAGSGSTVRVAPLTPGSHSLRVSLPGHLAYEQDVVLTRGNTAEVVASLVPLQPPHLAPPSPSAGTSSALAGLQPPVGMPPASLGRDVRRGPAFSPPRVPDFSLARTLTGHRNWVTAVAFNANGRLLASGSWDKTVKLWDVTTGREVRTLAEEPTGIEAIAFSPDGRWLATERSDNSVALMDAATGEETRVLKSHTAPDLLDRNWDYSLAFSPDGRWLAWGTDGKTVGLWEVGTGREVREFTGHPREVIYVAFSTDGCWLATGDEGETIDLWDTATGRKVRTLAGHSKDVYAVAFSPDNRWLASASGDKTVKLWDIATGHVIRTFTGHANRVTSVAFSPDGRYLASGGWDRTVKLWDVTTGRAVETLAGHDRSVYAIAFSPNGHWLASASEDKTVKVWALKGT